MKVEPAQKLRARGDTAYRLLAIIDSPAMPIFVEFSRSRSGAAFLKLHSASPNTHPFAVRVATARWSEINDRGQKEFVLVNRRQRIEPTDARESSRTEFVCIPEGSMDMEMISPGQVTPKSVDLCDKKQTVFANFLLQAAVEAGGNCAAGASTGASDVKRLEACMLAPSPQPSPPKGERE
jgi:hypothetical protein